MSTSISRACSAVKRCSAVSGLNSTAFGSPSTPAATARQKSMSKPWYSPPAVDEPEARDGVVDAAAERPALLHLAEQVHLAVVAAVETASESEAKP